MHNIKWTDERCNQLVQLEKVLREVAHANSANNFIRRMAEAAVLAEELLFGQKSLLSFLNGLAVDEREKRMKERNEK